MTFAERLRSAWNAFSSRDPTFDNAYNSISTYYRPDRIRLNYGNERSIITSIYNRIALDVSAVDIKHVRLDTNGRWKETIEDGLNSIFNLEANADQTARSFIQDIVVSMFDEGCVALVITGATGNPLRTTRYDIQSVRTGKVLEWYPDKIKVRVYNELKGVKEDIFVSKSITPIIENPFYSVMNEPNSTLKRLVHKLNLLDAVDEQSSAGKLDLIIQLPYVVKTEARRIQAENRRKDIEMQLAGSKYGIAYTDGTERITQLNRSVDNNLMKQIEYLTQQLYSQLGLTDEIMNGTANEGVMLNYNNRVIEPILSAIVDECKRKWLSETARSQGQSIMYFRDPFRLVPVNSIADIADKFTRNEILSSNEVRGLIGFKPSEDKRADELRNKNLNQSPDAEEPVSVNDSESEESQFFKEGGE